MKICTKLDVGIQANFVNLKGQQVIFGSKNMKPVKELASTQPRAQVKIDLTACKMRMEEIAPSQTWPIYNLTTKLQLIARHC